ncbi:MAG: FAD-dependent oxidoreductase [Oscillospiraceae bacterium]
MPDVIIIGGGPAGVSAALTAMHRNKSVVIVSSAPEDSALWRAERVDNYPGFPEISGRELVERLSAHAVASGAKLVRGRALSIMPMGGGFGVSVGSDFYEAKAVVLAAGLARAKPFPGEREFLGAGVSYCATCDGMLYRGKRVAVLGLSADAEEEAAFLASIGCEVEYFDKKRAAKFEIRGKERVETLVADGTEYPVSGVFVLRAGVAPGDLLPGVELIDGHISANTEMATAVPGVFACGDCVGAPYQIAKAVGEGNIAGISASKYVENTK